MRFTHQALLSVSVLLTGCSSVSFSHPAGPPVTGASLRGNVMDGLRPVAGAHVYLMAAASTGYGSASDSLLDPGSTGYEDAVGTYVVTAQDGSFTVPGYYTCTTGMQLYVYALGGDAGTGNNAVAAQLAALGSCPGLGAPATPVVVNEVTTVAAAFALAGFATDALHISSSGTALAQKGALHAFANAARLASIADGVAPATQSSGTPAGSVTLPQATVNTLANIAAACVHSSGPGSQPCTTLFADTSDASGTPADTATALIHIAHHPANNVATLFGLQAAGSPYIPALSFAPNDFSLGVVYLGGGLDGPTSMAVDGDGNLWVVDNSSVTEISAAGEFLTGDRGNSAGLIAPGPIAIDVAGNAWIGNYAAALQGGGSVVELSSNGTVLSGTQGYGSSVLRSPNGLGFDPAGHLWVANKFTNNVAELSAAGQPLSGPAGFTGGGLFSPEALAVDSTGNVWVANQSFDISAFSNSGIPLSGPSGFTGPGFYAGSDLAIDNQGNIWVTNPGGYAQVSKLSPAGVVLSGPTGYTGGGIVSSTNSYGGGYHIALDGASNAWIPLTQGTGVVELSNAGTPLSGANGYGGGLAVYLLAIAIDGSGDVWVSNATYASHTYTYRVTEMIGIAVPVVTPLAAGVANHTLGSRP